MKVKIPYKLTNKQRQAMNEEIQKQIYAARAAESNEYDAAILNCTKKKCRGTDECFAKERNKND